MTELGKKIKSTCILEGKNTKDLLEALNMSHQSLYRRYENDDFWRLSELEKVAKVLNKDITFFLKDICVQCANKN